MTLKGKLPLVPNCGGQMRASDMAQCGKSCKRCMNQFPCEDCKYWPIYPCYNPKKPTVDCLVEYVNDNISADLATNSSSSR